jgi:hypothetical protein
MNHDDERDYESEQADERDYRREQEAEWQEYVLPVRRTRREGSEHAMLATSRA